MNRTSLLVCIFLLPLAGKVVPAGRQIGASPRYAASTPSLRQDVLRPRLARGGELFARGRFLEAAHLFQQGGADASAAGDRRLAARFLGNAGACRLALRQYREALEAFSAARGMAESAGDASTAGAMDANTSSAYEQMGELDAAVEYAHRGARQLAGGDRTRHLPKVQIQLASLYARQGRLDEAATLFAEGIEGADRAGDAATRALGLDRLGEERLKAGEFRAAEQPLLEAWRARKLHRLPGLETSYRNLGRLRLAQGDLPAAEALLDRAAEGPRLIAALMPQWDVYHTRGLVRIARGDLAGALDDARTAVRLARAWRAGVSPADATMQSSERLVDQAYAALARAAAELYFRTRRSGLLRESFEAIEENRARSLRALIAEPAGHEARPPVYQEALADLQRTEAELVRTPGNREAMARAGRLRAALVEIENRGGEAIPAAGPGLLGRLQRALPPGAAWFTFHMGEPASYAWAVDRSGCEVYRLPGRAALAARIREFAAAVREGGAGGNDLYAVLFAPAGPRFAAARHWMLGLDDELFSLPVAALRHRGRYLAELHSIETVPAAELAAHAGRFAWSARLEGPFVGVGDPVYNTADARRTSGTAAARAFGLLQAAGGVQLPRLVGSGREIELCAREWNRPGTVLLDGERAARENLRAALRSRPAVVHLATHVLETAGRSRHGLIALSLREDAGAEILDPLEIAAWRADPALVVLSGCSSGAGPAPAGTGLMGLTRAWLASGASAVAATRWPTPDDTGALLRSFYRHLRAAPASGPAEALAHAQVEMLREGGWRASPRYWGAYFLVASR